MGKLRRFTTALGVVGFAVVAMVLLRPIPALSVSPSEVAGGRLVPSQEYGTCGFPSPRDLTAVCRLYHPYANGLVGTGACVGAECFAMQYGDYTRVVAPDDLGDFPRTLFVWPEVGALYTTSGDVCNLSMRGHKTLMSIQDSRTRCKAELSVGDYLYHEHFASNPNTRCLGWIECREDLITRQ